MQNAKCSCQYNHRVGRLTSFFYLFIVRHIQLTHTHTQSAPCFSFLPSLDASPTFSLQIEQRLWLWKDPVGPRQQYQEGRDATLGCQPSGEAHDGSLAHLLCPQLDWIYRSLWPLSPSSVLRGSSEMGTCLCCRRPRNPCVSKKAILPFLSFAADAGFCSLMLFMVVTARGGMTVWSTGQHFPSLVDSSRGGVMVIQRRYIMTDAFARRLTVFFSYCSALLASSHWTEFTLDAR